MFNILKKEIDHIHPNRILILHDPQAQAEIARKRGARSKRNIDQEAELQAKAEIAETRRNIEMKIQVTTIKKKTMMFSQRIILKMTRLRKKNPHESFEKK